MRVLSNLLSEKPQTNFGSSYCCFTRRRAGPEKEFKIIEHGNGKGEFFRYKKFERPILSKRMLEKARTDLEQMISFKENIAGGFVLDEVDKVLLERISRLELNDRESKQDLLTVDKGNGRVTATVAFIFCDKPSSYYNALPIQCWTGSDTYASLKDHKFSTQY